MVQKKKKYTIQHILQGKVDAKRAYYEARGMSPKEVDKRISKMITKYPLMVQPYLSLKPKNKG